jgi:hypothetical protein
LFTPGAVCCGAVTGGLKSPPPGATDFCVGFGAGAVLPVGPGAFVGAVVVAVGGAVVVVVVVVEVGDSSGVSPSLLHAAVKPTIARMAAPPTAAEIRRRAIRCAAMPGLLPVPDVVKRPPPRSFAKTARSSVTCHRLLTSARW